MFSTTDSLGSPSTSTGLAAANIKPAFKVATIPAFASEMVCCLRLHEQL